MAMEVIPIARDKVHVKILQKMDPKIKYLPNSILNWTAKKVLKLLFSIEFSQTGQQLLERLLKKATHLKVMMMRSLIVLSYFRDRCGREKFRKIESFMVSLKKEWSTSYNLMDYNNSSFFMYLLSYIIIMVCSQFISFMLSYDIIHMEYIYAEEMHHL